MKRHPLHSDEYVRNLDAVMRGGYAAHADRQTGHSTAIALETIALAIRRPYQPTPIRDHFGTPMADRHLLNTIGRMVENLRLKEMYFVQVKGGHALQFGKSE